MRGGSTTKPALQQAQKTFLTDKQEVLHYLKKKFHKIEKDTTFAFPKRTMVS
jgi:hypothetical protein